MKNIKTKMISLILLNVVLISIVLSIAFHLIINQYIWTEVEKTFNLNSEFCYFETNEISAVLESQNTIFSFTNLTIEDNYQGDDKIISLCIDNKEKLLNNDVIKSNFNGIYFYIKCIDKSENDFMVSIVNTTSVSNLANMVNAVFVVIILLAGLLFSIIAMCVGSKLENTQAKLKSFFANTTHELKTPLMSIQGYAEGIQKNLLDANAASSVIIKKSDEMNCLITRILELSKIDSGEIIRGKDKIDLNELFYQILDDLMLDNKMVHINFNNKENSVIGDEIQLYQLFSNVLTNAKRYMNTLIEITVTENHSYYYITIYNDGKQIEEQYLPHLLERFYKSDDGNTGIGLAISDEIAKLYKGKIVIQNTTGGVETIITLKK